jgi:hypothetical protein
MEQQRERTRAFLLLTMPQPYARDLGCATTLSTSTRSGRTGWLLSVFRSQCSIIWTVQPGQAVPLSVRRWKSIRLQPILASQNISLRSLYITTVRGKAEGRLSIGGEIIYVNTIIVSFAMRYRSRTSLYHLYGQLCQYPQIHSSILLLYILSCRSYTTIWCLLVLQRVKLRHFEMTFSNQCSATYLLNMLAER